MIFVVAAYASGVAVEKYGLGLRHVALIGLLFSGVILGLKLLINFVLRDPELFSPVFSVVTSYFISRFLTPFAEIMFLALLAGFLTQIAIWAQRKIFPRKSSQPS